MVSNEAYCRLLDSNLSLDHYFLIHAIHTGAELPQHPRIEGFLAMLEIKGLLLDGALSGAALDLLNLSVTTTTTKSPKKLDLFNQWTEALLQRLKAHLKTSIGKEQVKGFGGKYFMPGLPDLRAFLLRWDKHYGPIAGREERIEKVLLKHINDCVAAGKFAPTLYYFIIKDGTGSELAAVLDNYEELVEKPTQASSEQFQVIDHKKLFS